MRTDFPFSEAPIKAGETYFDGRRKGRGRHSGPDRVLAFAVLKRTGTVTEKIEILLEFKVKKAPRRLVISPDRYRDMHVLGSAVSAT